MRYFIKLMLLLLPLSLVAQTVTITGTVQDGNGAPYQNGTVRAVLVSGNGSGQQAWTFGGTNPVPSPQCIGGLDGFGHFTCPVTNTSLIDQQTALPQWQFQFNSFNYPVGGTRSCTVPSLSLSSNQDITTQIMAVPCPSVTSTNINLSSPPPIGNVTPNTGQFTNINSTVMVVCSSCTDWGAAIQTAYNSCPINAAGYASCKLVLPRVDNGPWISTFVNASPAVSLVGQGSDTTTFSYTGSSDAIQWRVNPFVVTAAGKMEGFTISGTSSGVTGIHMGDVIGGELNDIVLQNFTGSSSAGLWWDNVVGWTERTTLIRVDIRNNKKAWRFTNTGGTQANSSFGYTRALDVRMNVNASQIGMSVEGGQIYSSLLRVMANVGSSTGIFFTISGLMFSGGPNTLVNADTFDIAAECTSCTGATYFNIPSGFTVSGAGNIVPAAGLNMSVSGTLIQNGNTYPSSSMLWINYNSFGQTQNYYSVAISNPSSPRVLNVNDPGGNDAFVFMSASQALANKQLSSTCLWDGTPTHNCYNINIVNPLTARTLTISDPMANDSFVFASANQVLTNKSIQTSYFASPCLVDGFGVGHNCYNFVATNPTVARTVNVVDPGGTTTLPLIPGTPTVNTAVCWKTATTLGYCSTALSGTPPTCTCN